MFRMLPCNVRLQSSKKCDNRFSKINIRSVNAGIISGNGISNMQNIMSHLNLPRFVTSKEYSKKMSVNSVDIAEQSMIKASSTLISMYNDNYDDTDIESCEERSRKSSAIDGTWQKRYGFNSLLGVVFFISVDFGEVLDYEIKCKHCFECRCHSKWDKNSEKYQTWYNQHESEYSVNHLKSSESMEKEADIEMFLHSVKKRGLMKYTTYIGDGDSSYGRVAQLLKEGPKGSKSWCKYQLDVANGTNFYTQDNCLEKN